MNGGEDNAARLPERSTLSWSSHYLYWARGGFVLVHTNHSERQLRGVASGRKNYTSVGHVEAGEKIAALYTIVACCKAVHVNPTAYLTDLFERLDEHPDLPLESLMPSK